MSSQSEAKKVVHGEMTPGSHYTVYEPGITGESDTRAERAVMFGGLTTTQLSKVFRKDIKTTRRAIATVKPIGQRGGADIYDIADAAPYLCKPHGDDLANVIKNLTPREVPVVLQKPFWAAQNERLKYQEAAGVLWKQTAVQDAVTDLLKIVRQNVQLMTDTVERQTGLTPDQRTIINNIADGTLLGIYEEIKKHFANYDALGQRDSVLEEGPSSAYGQAPEADTGFDEEDGDA